MTDRAEFDEAMDLAARWLGLCLGRMVDRTPEITFRVVTSWPARHRQLVDDEERLAVLREVEAEMVKRGLLRELAG